MESHTFQQWLDCKKAARTWTSNLQRLNRSPIPMACARLFATRSREKTHSFQIHGKKLAAADSVEIFGRKDMVRVRAQRIAVEHR
jgi:hypothetical protein